MVLGRKILLAIRFTQIWPCKFIDTKFSSFKTYGRATISRFIYHHRITSRLYIGVHEFFFFFCDRSMTITKATYRISKVSRRKQASNSAFQTQTYVMKLLSCENWFKYYLKSALKSKSLIPEKSIQKQER